MDWNNYLILADELAKRTDSEAAMRSAISRAYYAGFHAVRDYLVNNHGFSVSHGAGSHVSIINGLKQVTSVNPLKSYRNLHRELLGLKTNRETADYENVEKGSIEAIVHEHLILATRFLGTMILLTEKTKGQKK